MAARSLAEIAADPAGNQVIAGYSFSPADLAVDKRLPGISAFIRTRNGADYIAASIESHLASFDEVVVVYNQCTDDTPNIVRRLVQQHGSRVRAYEYADRVFPPGSEGHAATPGDSPNSFVNLTNVALALTRHRIVTKVDDDHLAIPDALASLVQRLRADGSGRFLECFSGLNLMRGPGGQLGINSRVIFSGIGDVGFFEVNPSRYYTHDRRFEVFRMDGLRRRFAGIAYWHLKYLKTGNGFANYELADNPASRYHRQKQRFVESTALSLSEARVICRPRPWYLDLLPAVSARSALRRAQREALVAGHPEETLDQVELRLQRYLS